MESNSTHTWTLTCSITQEAMHVHKFEHTCLWDSCLIIVSAVHSHSSKQMQIIVSNLGPHISRVLQRTRPHQEHVSDLHATVEAFPHAGIATHPSALKRARPIYALVVPSPHNQTLEDTQAYKHTYMLHTCPCPPTSWELAETNNGHIFTVGWKCCSGAFMRHKPGKNIDILYNYTSFVVSHHPLTVLWAVWCILISTTQMKNSLKLVSECHCWVNSTF